ncbi:hypothetical protein ACFQ2T_12775 [Methylophilus flavus]|uniref:Uncharacterized protein n=1 Tax=Methylophilus flavus TaxID=640084 RepID=A0ABW3PDS8_9PROT
MTQCSISEISERKLVNGIDNGIKNDPCGKTKSSVETIQEQGSELELHITKPGHEFNDKEILDKNADA